METSTGPENPSSSAVAPTTQPASITPVWHVTSAAALHDAARRYMDGNFGPALQQQPDWYHSRLGLLIDFVTTVFGPCVEAAK